MPPAAYTIEARPSADGTSDALVYSEGEGRSIEFRCRAGIEPVPVWIPLGRWWNERAAPWAQREVIVERVRAWGALVYEAQLVADHGTMTTIRSPDGSFRIECLEEPDERAPAWERTRIIATAHDEVLVDLRLHGVTGTIAFPRAGEAVLDLRGRYGDNRRVRIDVHGRRYHLDGDAEPTGHPLHELTSRLAPPVPTTPMRAQAARRESTFDLTVGLLGAPFALGGLWLTLAAKSGTDRLAGFVGIFLGGFAFASAMAELRRRRATRTATSAPRARIPRSWLSPYAPLIAVGVELAWLALLLAGFLFAVGDAPYRNSPGSAAVRFWDLVAALPALAGLLLGIASIMQQRAQRPREWICLVLGSAGCGLFVLVFGREFLG